MHAPLNNQPGQRYRAFISYSHTGDRAIAVSLQRGLHRLGKRWYRAPSLRVFRDDSNLSASPQLWAAIEAAMADSTFFILLASPSAAESSWVDREVDWWLAHKRGDRFLIGLTEGDICWSETLGDFDRSTTTALPPALYGTFTDEPFWVDLRGPKGSGDTSLRNPEFRDRVATFAAPLHGRPKEDLVGEDLRQQRIWARLRNSALVVLAVLAALSATASTMFLLQRNEAQRQAAFAEAREFAARADQAASPYEALALSVEAELRTENPLPEARAAYATAVQWAALLPVRPVGARIPAHTESVTSLAWSPDGARLASTGGGALHLWDAATGQAVEPGIQGSRVVGDSVAWSPDGSRLATNGTDAAVLLWDAHTGQPLGEPFVPDDRRGPFGPVAWSPDGTRIASAGRHATVLIWDARTGELIGQPLRGHTYEYVDTDIVAVSAVAWSPKGTRLATGGFDGTVRLWDTSTGRQIGEPLRGHEGEVKSVDWSPDGKKLVSSSWLDPKISIWNTSTPNSPVRSFGDEALIHEVRWSPDGTHLVSTNDDGTMHLWDPATGNQVGDTVIDHEATSPVAAFYSVAWSPDGTRLATGNRDGTIRRWALNPTSMSRPPATGHSNQITSVAWSPDGTRLASSSWDGTVRFWSPETGLPVGEPLRHTGVVQSVAWSGNGSRLATSADSIIRIWDAATSREIRRLDGFPDPARVVAWSPAGNWLASANDDSTVWLWDAGTGNPIGPPLGGHQEAVTTVAWSRDGTQLAIAQLYGGSIGIWNFSDAKPADVIESEFRDTIRSVQWSPDGSVLASAGDNGLVQLHDMKSHATTVAEAGSLGFLESMEWSPDGSLVAVGSSDAGRVWLLDSARGVLVGSLADEENTSPTSLAFSPDGALLATGGVDGAVRFWSAVSEKQSCRVVADALSPNRLRSLLGSDRGAPRCADPAAVPNRAPIPAVRVAWPVGQ